MKSKSKSKPIRYRSLARRTMSNRLHDAISEIERANERIDQLYDVENRLRKVGDVLAQAYAFAFGVPSGKVDPLERANNIRDWIRTVKNRPVSSQSVEATAVAVIERCAAEAGVDMVDVRYRSSSEVGALIFVGDFLAVACKHGQAYMVRCRRRWRRKNGSRRRSTLKR